MAKKVEVAKKVEIVLDTFEIEVIGLNKVYNNNRQQCKVRIDIKKMQGESQVKLTKEEKGSLTLRPVKKNPRPKMAPGWSCDDDENNKYNSYPDSFTTSLAKDAPAKAKAKSNQVAETLYRYIRCDGIVTTQEFMACITLGAGTKDSKDISTNYDDGDRSYDFIVEIRSEEPPSWGAGDLIFSKKPFVKDSSWFDVDICYWALPKGLRIVEDSITLLNVKDGIIRNVEDSIKRDSETRKFWQFYSEYASVVAGTDHRDLNLGFAIKKEVASLTLDDFDLRLKVPTLTLDDFDPRPKDAKMVKNFTLEHGGDKLRAVRYNWGFPDYDLKATWLYDNVVEWTIIDNYGTTSRFLLKAVKDGFKTKLELTDP